VEAAFAQLLVEYCLEAQEGETILVEAEVPALPLLPHLKRAFLKRGAYPVFRIGYPGEGRDFLLYGGAWLERIPEVERALYEKADKFLRILSAENPLEGASLDPGLSLRHQRAWRPLAELRLKKRWTLTLYPTVGYAVGAGMGTERRWINSDGRRNMPSGEVFTGPLEESAEGEVRFNLPAFVGGRRVEGVYLRFRGGEVVEARAEVGEDYLLAALATDEGARRLGEVGIGTNFGLTRPTGLILLDEKMGGTVHLALGRSYPETGGKNESALHWDLVLSLAEGALLLDGKPLVEGGRFVGLPEPYPA